MPDIYHLGAMTLLGFLGTGHCVGMCGPLVLAVPASTGQLYPQLLYHAGRLTTYSILGAIAGALGAGLEFVASNRGEGVAEPLISVLSVQMILSVVAALFLAIFALVRIGLMPEPRWMAAPSPSRIPGFDRVTSGASAKGTASLFVWGMMLGTLPCGLSYAALARALPVGSVSHGAAMLLAFGLGTLPGLLLVGTVGARFLMRHRKLSDLISGALMGGMAVSLLVDALGN